jgi:hypothetical protein
MGFGSRQDNASTQKAGARLRFHQNKHGLVGRVRDWPHSSFHRDVQRSLFLFDRAGEVDASGEFGEA